YNPENKSKPGDFQKTREAGNSMGVSVAGFEVEPRRRRARFRRLQSKQPRWRCSARRTLNHPQRQAHCRATADPRDPEHAFLSRTGPRRWALVVRSESL